MPVSTHRTDHHMYASITFRPVGPSTTYSSLCDYISGYVDAVRHSMPDSTVYCNGIGDCNTLLIIPHGNEEYVPTSMLKGYVPYE